MKKLLTGAALAFAALALSAAGTAAAATWNGKTTEYVVLYKTGAPLASARLAVRQAGGLIVHENTKIGLATAYSANPRFLTEAQQHSALAGAARHLPVGQATAVGPKPDTVERLTPAERARATSRGRTVSTPRNGAEPLAGLQWDMAMMHATVDGTYPFQPGDRRVKVGMLDTGIEGNHPDLAPNFNAALSRNFTTDIPSINGIEIDGPCEVPSCKDPANVDDNGHGTHTAGTVGAALNGLGIAGVAPRINLINLRAGQDSGYFFLQPTVDALTYAGDNGVDVVNMSYYIDPWLYNCINSPEDSDQARREQGMIYQASQRAIDYAYNHGVTLISSIGNGHTDLDNPTTDLTSPDYPPLTEYPRHVNNWCRDMPTEGNNVISVIAVGPSTMKADYSNWGTEGAVLSAPGGYFRDYPGTPQTRQVENLILSTYSERLARLHGELNPDGSPNTPFVVRNCVGGVCGYYQWLQGTSMAGPHVVGAAALLISQWGEVTDADGGLGMPPNRTEKGLLMRAVNHPCPNPPYIDYAPAGRPAEYNARCEGDNDENNIWGQGIVDAVRLVRR